MKKILVFIFTVVILGTLFVPVYAGSNYLVDNSGVLSDTEAEAIEKKLSEVNDKLDVDIVIFFDENVSTDMESYVKEYYKDNGYGDDGIILGVDMVNLSWAVVPSGFYEKSITQEGIDYICSSIEDELKAEDYATCINGFIDRCEEVTELARDGKSYKAPFSFVKTLLICLVVGFVVALIVTLIMKGQLKSVRAKSSASDYVKKDSLNITLSNDLFLYRQVTRTPKPQSSSSSGGSKSRGGRF